MIAPDTPDRRDPLNNLGTIDSARNRMEAGRKEYEEAVKIYRELAEKNPENYLPEVAQMLNNLGLIGLSIAPRTGWQRLGRNTRRGLRPTVSWRRNTLRAICLP